MSAALAGPLLLAPRYARRGTAAAALVTARAFRAGSAGADLRADRARPPFARVGDSDRRARRRGRRPAAPAAPDRPRAPAPRAGRLHPAGVADAGVAGAHTWLADRPSWKRDPAHLAAARSARRRGRSRAPRARASEPQPDAAADRRRMAAWRRASSTPARCRRRRRRRPARPAAALVVRQQGLQRRAERARRRSARATAHGHRLRARAAARSRVLLPGRRVPAAPGRHGYWCAVSADGARSIARHASSARLRFWDRRPQCRSDRTSRAGRS